MKYNLLVFYLLGYFFLQACTMNESPSTQSGSRVSDTLQKITAEIDYQYAGEPLKIGVIGLVHTHVHWILGRQKWGDIEIVGIVEPNRQLAEEYAQQHGYSMDMVYDSMEEMIEKAQPEAVTAFNRIYDHLEVVAYCAPRGIHVMVEKPLAVSWEHAQQMIALAEEHEIHLLTNYETSWYGSHYEAYKRVVENQEIGPIRHINYYTGHPGPIEIGCNPEFLEWLTDPKWNGGGALTDFGCYGANLTTWLLQGQIPERVTCVTQQIKPDKYPKVEDEALIVLQYPEAQVSIQASWNWSHNRKETEIYGTSGFVFCRNGQDMEVQLEEEKGREHLVAPSLEPGLHDPFAYLTKIIRDQHPIETYGLSSLENNKIVMQILHAAQKAAETGETQEWTDLFGEE